MARPIIDDEFSHLHGKVSRQTLYQIRKRAKGLCRTCARKAEPHSPFCKKHKRLARLKYLERTRKKPAATQTNAAQLASDRSAS